MPLRDFTGDDGVDQSQTEPRRFFARLLAWESLFDAELRRLCLHTVPVVATRARG